MRKNFSKSRLCGFYSQLLALLRAGLPIISSLEIIKSQADQEFKAAINEVIECLNQGKRLAVSFGQTHFPKEDVNLIRIGEESGELEAILDKIIRYYENSIAAGNKIKKALTYPAIVLSLSIFSMIFLLAFILPAFCGFFSEFNAELPFLTRLFLGISDYWLIILLLLSGLAGLALFCFRKEEIRMNMPLIGPIYNNLMLSKICRGLGYQLKSGVPILRALAAVAGTVSNPLYLKALENVSSSLEQGERLSLAISKAGLFPDSLIQIIRIGEESGSLDEVLVQAGSFFEQESDGFIGRAVVFIEPASTLMVGGMVALIALSMVLPLFQMMEHIQ